jgi:hypothetical protein
MSEPNHSDRSSLREKCDKLTEDILNKQHEWSSGLFYVRGPNGFREYIADALESFAQEAYREGFEDLQKHRFESIAQAKAQARKEALEECKKRCRCGGLDGL